MHNKEIREKARAKGVNHWEIGERFGVNGTTFSIWMRHEFSPEKKAQALEYIDQIAREKGGAY